jgi:hypothetical protein
MSALFEVLSKIQKEMKAPKSQFNAFGKYKYRSCEDILEAVKPFLNGTVLYISDEMVLIGDRYYIKATATLRNGDEAVSVTAYAREEAEKKGMDSSQITGAASSYARKYALNGLFLIDDTKDSDATNEHGNGGGANGKPKGSQVEQLKGKLGGNDVADPYLTEAQAKDIMGQLRKAKIRGEALLSHFKVSRLGELRESQLHEVYDWILAAGKE